MIHELLAEAENERKHLMFFIEIAKPNWFERRLIFVAQFVFFFLLCAHVHLLYSYSTQNDCIL